MIGRYLAIVGLFILALTLQETWMPAIAIGGAQPDLLLYFIVFIGIFKKPSWGLGAGFVVGLIEDLLIGKYIGLHILSGMITGYLVAYFGGQFYKENYIIPIATVFAGAIISGFSYVFFSQFVSLGLPFWYSLWHLVLPNAIYSAALAPLIYIPVYMFFVDRNAMMKKEKPKESL